MKLLILGSLAVVAIAIFSFAQTGIDPVDKVLVAKFLSASQEAQFSTTDRQISAFWANWDGDFISMKSDDPLYTRSVSTISPFNGPDDARLVVRAAYSTSGVYFYLAVTDNNWVDPGLWSNDAVYMFIDKLSSAEIADQRNWIDPMQWAITYFSKQLLVPCGGTIPAASFVYCYYNDIDSTLTGLSFALKDPALGGLAMEVVSIDSVHKIQEWLIPWSQWGVTDSIATGMKFGFTISYNDFDSGEVYDGFNCVNSMDWIQLCTPYCLPDASLWGDIELGAGPIAVKPFAQNKIDCSRNAVRTDLYTVRGEKVSGAAKASGLVVKRQAVVNGKQILLLF